MSDYRDIFNGLILAAVEARMNSPSPIHRRRLPERRQVLNRTNLSAFLWKAHRKLRVGEELSWYGFNAKKLPNGGLRINVLEPGSQTKVYSSMRLTKDGLEYIPVLKKRGKATVALRCQSDSLVVLRNAVQK